MWQCHGKECLPHAAKGIFDLDLAQGFVCVRAHCLEQFPLLRDDLLECSLQVGLGSRVSAAEALPW